VKEGMTMTGRTEGNKKRGKGEELGKETK